MHGEFPLNLAWIPNGRRLAKDPAQTPGQPNNMGALLKEAVTAAGGRGGGSQDMAQGGVTDGSILASVLEKAAAALAGK